MSETTKNFEDLSKEQQKALKVAGRNFVIGMFLNGINFGALFFVSNLLLLMMDYAFFQSKVLLFLLCVSVDIYLLNLMVSINKEKAKKFKDTVKQIIK